LEGEWFYPEASDEVESGIEMETDGLTPLTYWAPTDSTKFKYAAVCHDLVNDIYGIAAVFERNISGNIRDSVYFLRVEGDSADPNYGKMLAYTRLETAYRIDSVDCTQNDSDSIYVAYDRKLLNARWWKITGYSLFGPYEISQGSSTPACYPYTHRPRIAFGDPSHPNVHIVYEPYIFSTPEHPGCEVCAQTFTDSGSSINDDCTFWGDNMTHTIYDVEWNGSNLFVVVLPYHVDAATSYLDYIQYDYDGDHMAEGHIQSFIDEPSPPFPGVVKIVNTYYHYNQYHYFIVQTDKASTYWLGYNGQRMIVAHNPRYDYGGSNGDKFAVCEYWGLTPNRIAHTYKNHSVVFPRPAYNTVHWQWDRVPSLNDPHETYYINDGFYPEACNAADTIDDYDEVLLVSRKNVSPPDYRIFWNIEPQE
jgi:hypothetical protein